MTFDRKITSYECRLFAFFFQEGILKIVSTDNEDDGLCGTEYPIHTGNAFFLNWMKDILHMFFLFQERIESVGVLNAMLQLKAK